MSTNTTIALLGKDYPFRFGMKFQRIFMQHLKINKLSDFQKKLGLLEKMETLESFDVLGYFLISSIEAASKKPLKFDLDDVIDDVSNNGISQFQEVFTVYMAEQTKITENNSPGGDLGKSKTAS